MASPEEQEFVFWRRVYIGAPADEVWPWLVEPERVGQYQPVDLWVPFSRPGDPVRYHGKLAGQVVVEGEVLQFLEGRLLVHTYQLQVEPLEMPSRVTYELLRYGERLSCLEFRHDGLDPLGEAYRSVSRSWDVVLSSLKTLIETGKPLPWPTRGR